MLGIAIFFTVIIFDIGMYVNPDSFYRLTHGGEEARLGGYIINPNELGMLCALGISCSIFMWRYEKNKGWTIVRTLLMLWAMLMTGSRSSLVGCFLIIFFHIRQAENKKLQILMYLGAAAAVPVGVAKIFLKQGGLDEVLSMTGRLPFWTALLTEGLPKEPLFGFGFMRIAYTDLFESVHTYAGHMTHNTFIQVLMNLGIVGFIIVLIQMIFTFKAFLKEEEINKLMMIGIIIPVLINSFTEFGIFGETNFSILFYQLLIFSVSINPIKILTRSEKILLKRTRPELQTA
jgi:O-antigen ligase